MLDRCVSRLALLAATILFLTSMTNADEAPDNLMVNGDLEQTADAGPVAWAPHSWVGTGQLQYVNEGRTGKCVKIESSEGGDLSWETFVDVEPGSVYLLSGWIKTENLQVSTGQGALLNVHGGVRMRTAALVDTNDWTRVEAVVRTGELKKLHVNCLFGGWGLATGTAWFDDIRLVPISLDTLQPQATIQCDQQGEPISKYIYAQFIEHLGRCIYGGIWAEMLDDRKFYHEVGAEASPWHVIGREEVVSMVADDSFVGDQTPLIPADEDGSLRGLVQSGLGLRQGKGYTGYIWLKATEQETSLVEINLVWDDGPTGGQTVRLTTEPGEYTRFPLKFTSGGDTDDGRLEIVVSGQGGCLVGIASLMPDDNVQGMRADTLVLLKELNSPMYRWPGGNFVSGYDWRDGIGPRDRRPPRKNPAWRGAEHNDFGLDEFVAFCREVQAEPLIVVNTGFGDAYSAAQEVEYANGSAETVGGSWRVANGHPEPYNVRWWGIGNEMYGRWQLGHMQLGHYEIKHNEVVRKMRAVDPDLRLIAVGNVGEWSEGMLQKCGDAMDLISEHFYCQEIKDSVAAHVAQIPDRVRAKAETHRRYRETIPGLADKDIRIAMDEWNYWYGEHVYGELGTRYHLKDGLGIAAGLHEFFRNTDIISMAQYAQTVNVIGCIKTNKTDAAFATTGLVLKLYRQQFGRTPLALTGNTSLLDLDLAAALTEDGKTITIGVVNPHDRSFDIQVDLAGRAVAGDGQVWRIAGGDPMLFNEPGQPERVSIVEDTASFDGQLAVPPYSANLFAFPLGPAPQ